MCGKFIDFIVRPFFPAPLMTFKGEKHPKWGFPLTQGSEALLFKAGDGLSGALELN